MTVFRDNKDNGRMQNTYGITQLNGKSGQFKPAVTAK